MRSRMTVIALIATLIFLAGLVGCSQQAAPASPSTSITEPTASKTSSATSTASEDVAAFFKGKTLTIIVPDAAGGGMDLQARILAPYLAKYTGANVVVQNMVGAAGKTGTNYLYNTAKPDGLTLSSFPGGSLMMAQFFGDPGVNFDIPKMSWVGIFYVDPGMIALNKNVPNNLADIKKMSNFKLGLTNVGIYSLDESVSAVVLNLDNTNILGGYSGTSRVALAVASGELNGMSTITSVGKTYIDQGLVKGGWVLDTKRSPNVPDTPTIYEVAKQNNITITPEDKNWLDLLNQLNAFSRPFGGPPGIPQDRLQFLRDAYWKCVQDPAYQKDMKDKAHADVANTAENGADTNKIAQSMINLENNSSNVAALKDMVETKYQKK